MTMPAPSSDVRAEPATGRIAQINLSGGGVPKLPVAQATVGELGSVGDAHRDKRHHGGPERALCLFSLEVIERLQAEGHPISPGSTGENLTLAGINFDTLESGSRLRLGFDVLIELTKYTTPCTNIIASFMDGDFSRILQTKHPGESRLYARVLQGGEIATGDPVTVEGLEAN